MTLARYIMSRSLGFAVVTKVYAVSSGALACGLPVSLDGLYDVDRKSAGAVTIVRYIRKESPYIYKTSFDTRTVTVAAGRTLLRSMRSQVSVVEIAEWKSARPSWWFLHIRIKLSSGTFRGAYAIIGTGLFGAKRSDMVRRVVLTAIPSTARRLTR